MFKARLIENSRYYKLIRYQWVIFIFLLFPYNTIFKYIGVPDRWILPLLISFSMVISGLIYLLYQRPLNRSVSKKSLVIEKNQIRIIGGEDQNVPMWNVDEADAIITSRTYYMPNDERIFWLDKIRRPRHHNFLEIRKGDQQFRLEFHLDSHYMGVQITKIIDHWLVKGIPVNRI